MKLSRPFLFSLLAVGCFSLAGCCNKSKDATGNKRASNQEIRINVAAEPKSLDPRKTTSLSEINITRTLNEGLMRVNKSGATTNALAESISLSQDNLTYTFKLRESVWSNGDPVTSHDFIYAWKKILSPNFPSSTASLLFAIKNGADLKNGNLPSNMLGLQAKDDLTLVVTLEAPTPYFLEMASLPAFFPINAKVDQENPEWSHNANTYISNGPFRMAQWKHCDTIVAVKNDLYWDADAVQLNQIEMIMVDNETELRMFQTNELHWTGSPYSSLPIDAIASLEGENLIKSDPMLGTYWIRTNTALFPLHSPEIRKALAFAIDRKEIVSHVAMGGHIPATGIVPLNMGLQQTPYFTDGDTNQAEYLLNVALEAEGLTKDSLPSMTLTYPNDSRTHRIAQAVQDQWRKTLDLDIRLEALEAKVYFDRVAKGDYQLACGSWTADFNDPVNFLEVFKSANVTSNQTNWESLDYQKALEASYLSETSEDRLANLQRSEEIIMDEMPIIPVFHISMMHTENENLKDVVLTASGHIDFKWAYITE